MPLSILLPMVIVGIAGIAVLLHLLGLSRSARLESEGAASAAWLREFPEDPPIRITLCGNHSAALIVAPKGQGVVWPVGADTTARYLAGATLTRTGTGLRIDLPDFTAPRIHLTLEADEAADWSELLENAA